MQPHKQLPADISRCTNDRCPLHQHCLRWLHRNDLIARVFIDGDTTNGVSHCFSPSPTYQPVLTPHDHE